MNTIICSLKTAGMKPFAFCLTILINFVWISSSQAQQNPATIQGKVITETGLPLPFANVYLKDKNKGALTDEEGHFTIDQVTAGKYILVISHLGYATKEIQLKLENGQTLYVPAVSLLENGSDLLEFTLTDGRINEFANKETDYVARMPLKNLENPQVYSIVNKELMEEQIMTDIKEPLRSAPGVVPADYITGMFSIVSRGFRVWSYARNGLATSVWRSGTEIANLERIELIKGPSGTLFGSNVSSFGGAINLVTKKPHSEFKGQVGYGLGSFGLSRFNVDVNSPLNKEKTLLFRLNAVHHQQNSFNEFGRGKRLAVAPSLSYQVNDRLSILFDLEYMRSLSTRLPMTLLGAGADFGSFRDIPMEFEKSFFLNDLQSDSEAVKYFTRIQYDLGSNWTSTTDISHINEYNENGYQPYHQWINKTTVLPYVVNFGPRERTSANIQQNFNGSFQTGSVHHNLLLGISYEYLHESSISRRSFEFDTLFLPQSYRYIGKTTVDQLLADPTTVAVGEIGQNSFGAYVSDVIQWTDRLSTMLSVRWDRFERTQGSPFTQTAFSPKLGIIYQPLKDRVSLFANYMNGFQNQAPRDQPDGNVFTPDPVFANQMEGGVKTELLNNKLNATLSYYHISIDNAIRMGDDQFTFQDGQQVSKGVELELIANPISGLNIVTGYGFNENKIVRAESFEGNLVQGAPQHMVNYWISYRLPIANIKGLGLGFGGNYVGESYYNASNTMVIPSYHLLNATAFYDTGQWRAGLKFNNITDERYWDISGNQQFTRNFVANFSFRF
ncbi:TonB-dependent receptor [Arthrospiribacter ruber]|uniref:TonB-dependent receptor n=1 Tax=Arthrospiribacter ruber TaxID=2487934 RepID=A0A951M7S1_9BACT|nr:TonB-dependent receptor [Arthrospiribacter ruber]MBW3466976.1 TonB-dependent receptor [Arthrospiribacter ruber]